MGRRSLETHDHSSTGNGGDDINPKTIGEETPAESISTSNLEYGPDLREANPNESRTFYASNYTNPDEFIGEALPWFVSDSLVLVIDEDKPDWDLYLPAFWNMDSVDNPERGGILIRSDGTRRDINSLMVSGTVGRLSVTIRDINVTGETPYADEPVGVFGSYASEVHLQDVSYSGSVTWGACTYGAGCSLQLDGVDFGNGVCDHAVVTKHEAVAWEQKDGSQRNQTEPTKGTVNQSAYWPQEGRINFNSIESDVDGDNYLVQPLDGGTTGTAFDWASGQERRYNLSRINTDSGFFRISVDTGGDFRVDDHDDTPIFRAEDNGFGIGQLPENLSGQTGNFDGHIRLDDGTNTAARNTLCVWDNSNSVWRPANDPTASFT